jgi:hypothetical protein
MVNTDLQAPRTSLTGAMVSRFVLDAVSGGVPAYLFVLFRRYDGEAGWSFAVMVGIGAALAAFTADRLLSTRGLFVRTVWATTLLVLTIRMLGKIEDSVAAWIPAVWLAVAITCLLGLLRRLARRYSPGDSWEGVRLAGLTLLACWLGSALHRVHPIGAGDAHWYTLMLGDFVEQIRQGQFPVWLGATEYAFNGTFSPLRLAPWFQHVGGLVDAVTLRTLTPPALKNLTLSLNFFVLTGSTYLCLRLLLKRAAWLAGGLTAVVVLSPACLMSIHARDQYMTFMALPFLPLVAAGLWLLFESNRRLGPVLLGVGTAGLWLSHTPVALWASSIVGGAAVTVALLRRSSSLVRGGLMAIAIFGILGTYSIHSALGLENVNRAAVNGSAFHELTKAFPANFSWLSPGMREESDIQVGLAALVLLGIGVVTYPRIRTAGAGALGLTILAALLLILPIPSWSEWFWSHLPLVILQATNVWSNQRLVPIFIFFIIFFFAAVLEKRPGFYPFHRRWIALALGVVLLTWSGYQGARLVNGARQPIAMGIHSQRMLAPHNLVLTRYSFSPFESAPGYFSHGYIDPVFEHRLLHEDGTVIAHNGAATARRGSAKENADLLAAGEFEAINDNGSVFYPIQPKLELNPGELLALHINPMAAPENGVLQVAGTRLFREYLLPDSGAGINNPPTPSPTGFGTTATSSRVISVPNFGPDRETIELTVIAPERVTTPSFLFARFELWRYRRSELPIAVQSWVPYRLLTDAASSSYLETPRVWLPGYRARINGKTVPAERSADNRVMFKIPAGHADITIKYAPSLLLEVHYWVTVGGWAVCLLGLGGVLLVKSRETEAPP